MEIAIGKWNTLPIIKSTDFGLYLGIGETQILLPNRYVPEQFEIGDSLHVFIFLDSEDRLTACNVQPYIEVDKCAALKVVDVNSSGVFLDWGLPKDLLLPYKECKGDYAKGEFVMVRAICDVVSGRIYATENIRPFLQAETEAVVNAQQFTAMVWREEEYGIRCILDNTYEGVIHHSELLKTVYLGEELPVYVKSKLENGKINLQMRPIGVEGMKDAKDIVYQKLVKAGGFLPFNDASDPESIKNAFAMSKKTFKNALGMLYKEQIIELRDDGIQLVITD